ncbi:MAG: tetratricopeptide repeat protein [Candidatus Heimdallarchaeota archaeon]|nr:tetratricopeptide repeat protein [Candidatus Heimdallarchaeota archaeon]
MDILDIDELKEQGMYNEALQAIDSFQTISTIQIMQLDIIKADILLFKGQFEVAEELIKGVVEYHDSLSNVEYLTNKMAGTILLAGLNRRMGKINEGLMVIETFELEHESFLTDEMDDKWIVKWKARFYHEKGNLYLEQGNLDKSEQSYMSSIAPREKINEQKGLASVYTKLAQIQKLKGNYPSSLELLEKSLIYDRALGNEQSIAITLGHIGLIQFYSNEFEKAFENLERSFLKLKERHNDYLTIQAAYNVFSALIQEKRDLAKNYSNIIEEIANKKENQDNRHIQIINKLSQARLLKTSIRGKDKYKSQDIYNEIVQTSDIRYKFKVEAMIQLIDLLLEELETYNEQEVLLEVIQYIYEIERLAEINKSNVLLIESLIIEARFQLVKNDVEACNKIYDKALLIAESYGLTHMVDKIDSEKTQFEEELANWSKRVNKGEKVLALNRKREFNKYLSLAKSFIDSMDLGS